MATKFNKDDVVSIVGKSGKWVVTSVFPPDRYKVTAMQDNDIIVKNCIVKYPKDSGGVECIVVGRIDSQTITIKKPDGNQLNVKEAKVSLVHSNKIKHNDVVYAIEAYLKGNLVKIIDNKGQTISIPARDLVYVDNGSGYGTGQVLDVMEIDIVKFVMKKYQITVFKSYPSFVAKMDEWLREIEENQTDLVYSGYMQNLQHLDKECLQIILEKMVNWFGEPFPKNLREMKERSDFQNMPLYEEFKEKFLKPLMKDLRTKSFANLLTPKLLYNEIEIGMFDFAKASANLLTKYQYYSLKHKKIVDHSEVKIFQEDGKYIYLLKHDDSKVVVLPVFEDGNEGVDLQKLAEEVEKSGNVLKAMVDSGISVGTKKFSTIKKSYLSKEKIVRPKNAVRIFTEIGADANITANQIMFSSVMAIAATEILEAIGYSVNLNAVFGYRASSGINLDGNKDSAGLRAVVIPIKNFDETIYLPRALYIMADATHFRYKLFRYQIGMYGHFKDYNDFYLGQSLGRENAEAACFHKFMPIDKHKGILYLFLGSKFSVKWDAPVEDIVEQARNQALEQIRDMITTCELSNQQAREFYNSK